jgi:ABC-type transporter Mla subunit MlaD
MAKRRRNPFGRVIDRPWHVVIGVVVIAFAWWAIGTRQQPHHVRAMFSSAFNLVSGQAVSVDGLEVGKISKVSYDGSHALVEIGINDGEFWPLHAGTRVISRWGTTIGSGTRRLDLIPGPSTAPALHEGGIIPMSDTQPAVDVDQVLNALNGDVRNRLRGWMAHTDASLRGHTAQTNLALHTASGGVSATGDLMSDLAVDTYALRGFVDNTHRLTQTVAAHASGVRDLVTVAARTFETFANNTQGTQDSIAELPQTLRVTRNTLGRVNTSIDKLNALVTALAPGARQLSPLAQQAVPTLAALRRTVPSAVSTVERATTASPRLVALMNAATPFLQAAPGVFDQLSPMIACIRPYAPELGGALVGGDGSHQNYDLINPKLNPQIVRYVGRQTASGMVEQHGLRATPMVSESTPEKPLDSATFAKVSGKLYAYPRPPGLTTGQPWFMPECGITQDALNPAKDPEKP